MEGIYDKLKELQVVLAQKFEIEDRKIEIPRVLADKEAVLQKTKISYLEQHDKSERINDEINALRERLDAAEKEKSACEKKMETIATSREFDTLSKEINELKESATQIRKSLIAKEDYYKQLQEKLTGQEGIMNDQIADVEEEKAAMDKQLAECDAELALIDAKCDELSVGIDADLVYKFKRIIRNKKGLGIVPIHNFICEGCHMELPAQFVNDVRKDEDSIHFCPYCSRILFYEESDENLDIAEKKTERQDDTEDVAEEESGYSSIVGEGEVDDFLAPSVC